ncbi:hypothetical protein FRC02_001243 [Tulasnella sp. 418]|nr:hypothetical protein FRC02_001243 [Tulasnella sp. 418]
MADTQEQNAYELLEIEITATEPEIKKAYRQKSLKVHPDRHPNNPDAAHKFHLLNSAYELLLDPIKKTALDNKIKADQARKLRFAGLNNKRKAMLEELERSEQEFKKAKVAEREAKAMRLREEERIKEEGKKMREEREMAMKKESETKSPKGKEKETEESPPSSKLSLVSPWSTRLTLIHVIVGPLDNTVRIKWTPANFPELKTSPSLTPLFSQFGTMDTASIVISIKPNKKNPSKPPKSASAMIPFIDVQDAFSAVMASGRKDRGLQGIEVTWAAGQEPEFVQWLRSKGRLGLSARTSSPSVTSKASEPTGSFSSFPDAPSLPTERPASPPSLGIDYATITLMHALDEAKEKCET